MALIIQENILKAWKTLFAQDSDLATQVPGGIWTGGPVPEAETDSPYATLAITEQPPNWTSGRAYWQDFAIDVRIWSTTGATNSGAIRKALHAVFNQDNKDSLTITGATRAIDLSPDTGQLAADPRRKNATDVLITSQRWKLTLQGNR